MTAEIHQLPSRPDREWRHIAEALRSGVMQRTGSAEIADAVVARCKRAFDVIVPHPFSFNEEPPEDVMHVIEVIVGGFIGEVGLLAEEIELMKANGGESA
jgi:hypothetical protein